MQHLLGLLDRFAPGGLPLVILFEEVELYACCQPAESLPPLPAAEHGHCVCCMLVLCFHPVCAGAADLVVDTFTLTPPGIER